MSRWNRLLAALGAGLLAIGVMLTPVAVGASTPHYDHNSPTTNWGGYTCADDAQVLAATNVTSYSTGARMGTVELLHSPRCNAYWAQVIRGVDMSQFPHYWFSAAIVADSGTDIYCQFAEPTGFTGGGCYTAMLTECGFVAKGIMFHNTNQDIVAYGQLEIDAHCRLHGAGIGGR